MALFDTAVAAVLFAVFAGMVAAAARYPPEARVVPLVIGIPGLVLSAWQVAREIARCRSSAAESAAADEPDASDQGQAVLWLMVFVLLVLAGGFVVGGTLAVMVSQRFWLRESWRTTLIGGAVAFVTMSFGLERQLGLVLFTGWLME
jgi:hypothetical protein